MPTVIAMVSSKGGAGKSTLTLALASVIVSAGARVTIIDMDQNRPFGTWEDVAGGNPMVEVIRGADPDNLYDRIDSAAGAVILIDTEGVSDLSVATAIGASDLVITPCSSSKLDASQAARSAVMVRTAERATRRRIAHCVAINRVGFVRSRQLAFVEDELKSVGIHVLSAALADRDAFRAAFAYGALVQDLPADGVPGVEKAMANAAAVLESAMAHLKAIQSEKKP